MKTNKVAREFAHNQIRALEGQDFFKQSDIVIAGLVRSLVENADDLSHIERMVTTWVNRTRAMLHPSDIAELASQTAQNREPIPPPPPPPPPPPGCDHCGHTGWNPTTRTYKRRFDEDTIEEFEMDCVEPCDCPLGRKIAQAEQERAAKTPKVREVVS